MKKLISLLLACVMLGLSMCSALAEATEPVELLMTAHLPSADLTLTHEYASQYYRSSTQFEVYTLGDEAPVLRLRINHWTDAGFMDLNGITFTLGEESFTFENVGDPTLSIYARPSYSETLLITFDEGDADFIAALLAACESLEEGEVLPCQVVLHGIVDENAELGADFAQDFLLMYQLFTGTPAVEQTLVPDPVEYYPAVEPESENTEDIPAVEPETEPTEDAPATENTGDIYIVVDATNATVKDRAAIRFSPSISAAVLVYAYTGDTFRVRYEEGDWYCIDVEGKYGYIHKGVAYIQE